MEYEHLSEPVKKVIATSLGLTTKNLAYTFGSDSPAKGGMDCSGAISFVLKSLQVSGVPRTSYAMYHWANDCGNLTRLTHVYNPNHPTLTLMKPGDLVFWEGTHTVKDRTPPISHVMLYLGTLKKDGKGVLFGASSGRRFRGRKIHGVSVFDFKVPAETSKATLVAFGPIPGIRDRVQPEPLEQPSEDRKRGPLHGLKKVFQINKNKSKSQSSQ